VEGEERRSWGKGERGGQKGLRRFFFFFCNDFFQRYNRLDKRGKLPQWVQNFMSPAHLNLSTDMAVSLAKQFLREMAQPFSRVSIWENREERDIKIAGLGEKFTLILHFRKNNLENRCGLRNM
jgi:hypothetical protein